MVVLCYKSTPLTCLLTGHALSRIRRRFALANVAHLLASVALGSSCASHELQTTLEDCMSTVWLERLLLAILPPRVPRSASEVVVNSGSFRSHVLFYDLIVGREHAFLDSRGSFSGALPRGACTHAQLTLNE